MKKIILTLPIIFMTFISIAGATVQPGNVIYRDQVEGINAQVALTFKADKARCSGLDQIVSFQSKRDVPERERGDSTKFIKGFSLQSPYVSSRTLFTLFVAKMVAYTTELGARDEWVLETDRFSAGVPLLTMKLSEWRKVFVYINLKDDNFFISLYSPKGASYVLPRFHSNGRLHKAIKVTHGEPLWLAQGILCEGSGRDDMIRLVSKMTPSEAIKVRECHLRLPQTAPAEGSAADPAAPLAIGTTAATQDEATLAKGATALAEGATALAEGATTLARCSKSGE